MKTLWAVAAILAMAISPQATAQDDIVAERQDLSQPLRVLSPHPLEGCEVRRRKLSCEALQSHSGFIFTINLRNNGRTLQYQISAMSRLLQNDEFKADFEPRVRHHLEQSLPMIAEMIGWEPGTAETEALLDSAAEALSQTEISTTPRLRAEGESYLAFLEKGKETFEGGAIYATRDRIMNSYSVYIDKPGYKATR